MILGSGKNIHPLKLKSRVIMIYVPSVFHPTFWLHFHHGRVKRASDYNPSLIEYALLCDLELLSFPFWASVSFSENDIIVCNCFQKPSLLL